MIRPGMLYPAQYPADTPEFEYIRKDALLEWAKIVKQQSEELKEAGQGDVFYGAQIALIDEVIAKIKSL